MTMNTITISEVDVTSTDELPAAAIIDVVDEVDDNPYESNNEKLHAFMEQSARMKRN
jgi:hypothetical protein